MMLTDQIAKDMTAAMKARDPVKLSALRMLKAAMMNAEVAKGRALEDADAQQVLSSMIKQRRDSIEQFTAGGRTELADKERAELAILEAYAPPAVSAAEIEQAIDAAISETGAASAKDMGRVMKAVMSAMTGRGVDGKVVNELVRKRLS